MLGLTITAFSAILALGLVVWHKVIVPFDRMNQLSRELDDPGYRVEPAPETAEVLPQDNHASFTNDLQMVYKATRQIPSPVSAPIPERSPANVSPSRR
ncbi:MAG TPA: hypothetical protein VG297_25530 [Bryobacteraceae bacterium]|jgi:hypothetical protein|nr:hypothetical protein [Bryobacteraceae bacterium]